MTTDWSAHTEWWRQPHTCYAKGLADGVQLGREQAYREIFGAFAQTIGADELGLKEAMDRQIKAIESKAARNAWDATAATPRQNDHPGRAA